MLAIGMKKLNMSSVSMKLMKLPFLLSIETSEASLGKTCSLRWEVKAQKQISEYKAIFN